MHVNVIIEQSVVDKINTAIYRFPDMETGGQLIGSIGKDAITGSYTVYVADLYHEISQVGTGSGLFLVRQDLRRQAPHHRKFPQPRQFSGVLEQDR